RFVIGGSSFAVSDVLRGRVGADAKWTKSPPRQRLPLLGKLHFGGRTGQGGGQNSFADVSQTASWRMGLGWSQWSRRPIILSFPCAANRLHWQERRGTVAANLRTEVHPLAANHASAPFVAAVGVGTKNSPATARHVSGRVTADHHHPLAVSGVRDVQPGVG